MQLSIPTPSCLSNQLKLRIFPPNNIPSTSSSFQSLSSASDVTDPDSSPSWDMTADPYVTRTVGSRRSTAYQYQNFADDESSDSASAPGFSDGVGIQGTFPSTERVRVRWAMPVRGVDDGAQGQGGRRRVGVKSAKGEMTCNVLGRAREQGGEEREGVLMQLDYKGSCKGIWFPGVATLLGMDVALETKNCEVSWPKGYPQKWIVTGGTGFTGHEVSGGSRSPSAKDRQTSSDMAQANAASEGNAAGGRPLSIASTSSTSSQPSLLRAPLPTNTNMPDYSFESGQNTPSESGMSSMLSRSRGSSLAADGVEDEEEDIPAPPASPVTLHLNMNDLLPPNKNVFTFNMSGVVLVVPRSSSPHNRDNSNLGSSTSSTDDRTHSHSRSHPNTPSRSQSHTKSAGAKDKDLAVFLPRFRVLASDSEHIETTVKNGLDIGIPDDVEVYASADPKAKKSELAKGGRTKISAEGGKVVLKTPPPPSAFAAGTTWSEFQHHQQQQQQGGAGDTTMTFDEYGIPTGVSSVHATPRMGMLSEPEGYNVEGTSTYQTPNRARGNSDARMSVAMTGGSVMTDTWGPSSGLTSMMSTRPRRDGPLMIPTVKAIVTPFIRSLVGSEESYAVRFECPAPADEENEWLEFFLAQSASDGSARPSTGKGKDKEVDGGDGDESVAPPAVKVVSASVDGVPVKVEISTPRKLEDSLKSAVLPVLPEGDGKRWITRVRVRTGDVSGGKVEVIYVADGEGAERGDRGQEKQRAVDVALPLFSLPVGWLQVEVEPVSGELKCS